MKKSQLYSQIFYYILALVLISLLLVYGYNSIRQFQKRTHDITEIKFKNDLTNTIKSISGDFGSVVTRNFVLNSEVTKVCFFNNAEKFDSIPITIFNELRAIDPIMEDSISANSTKNIFLIEEEFESSYKIGKTSIVDSNNNLLYYLCLKTKSGKISIKFEGKGDNAQISTIN